MNDTSSGAGSSPSGAGSSGSGAGSSPSGAGSSGSDAGRSSPLAVVTGASGFVGSHVVDELLRRGARVRALVREGSSRRWLEGKPVEVVPVPLVDGHHLEAAVAGAEWIVHAAGLVRASSAAEFHHANVTGTECVLRAALATRSTVKRFLYVSSQAAAGPSANGTAVEEAQEPRPVSPYGESKLGGEQATLRAGANLPVTVIRPPAIYGPRDTAILSVFAAGKRHIRPVFRRRGRFSIVHVSDLAAAVHTALVHEAAVGQVFFAAEPEVTDYTELGALVARSVGTWSIPVRVPGMVLECAALCAEAIGVMTRRPPLLSRQKLREIGAGDWICSSAKIRSHLGWSPGIQLQDGIARTADWYREAGWL